jgi:ribonuclease P/MRP protein subunit POP5
MVRFKNRWLLVEFIPCENQQPFIARLGTGTNFNGKQIWNALKQSVLANFGDAGWGAVGYSLNGTSEIASLPMLR